MTTAQARALVAKAHERTDSTFTETIGVMRYHQQRNHAAYRSHRKRALQRRRASRSPARKKR